MLILARTLDVGGTERQIAMLAPGLVAAGFAVTVLLIGKRGALAGALAAEGVEIVGPPLVSDARIAASRLARSAALGLGSLRALAELLLRPPAVVHFFLPHAYIAGGLAARLARPPVRVMSRRSQNDYQAKHPRLSRIEHRLHRDMTAIIANSRRVARELVDEGADRERLRIIYNGVDLARFAAPFDALAARARLAIPAGALVMVTLANLIAYKGHADLIAALGRIRDSLPPIWRLLVVGRDDGIGEALKEAATREGIGERILWLGLRDDVPDLLRLADIGILASHEEGFSNAVLESMAAGLAMVVTDVGGNREAVGAGEASGETARLPGPEAAEAGLLVPPRAPHLLAEAILTLTRDRERMRAMGVRARERAGSLFSRQAMIDAHVALYEALIEGDAPPGEPPAGEDGSCAA
ncbi:MAG: glycosyltransferase [Hyphomicrobiaceae bacterium]